METPEGYWRDINGQLRKKNLNLKKEDSWTSKDILMVLEN